MFKGGQGEFVFEAVNLLCNLLCYTEENTCFLIKCDKATFGRHSCNPAINHIYEGQTAIFDHKQFFRKSPETYKNWLVLKGLYKSPYINVNMFN